MSIYRRTDRVPLNDLTVTGQVRTADVRSQNDDDYWATKRASRPANGLLPQTVTWASALPDDVRPDSLLAKFPRIANLIAVLWQDPNSVRRYMDDLLVDKRGNRQGFPLDVLRELLALRSHFDEVNPEASRPWEVMNNSE